MDRRRLVTNTSCTSSTSLWRTDVNFTALVVALLMCQTYSLAAAAAPLTTSATRSGYFPTVIGEYQLPNVNCADSDHVMPAATTMSIGNVIRTCLSTRFPARSCGSPTSSRGTTFRVGPDYYDKSCIGPNL